MDINEPPVPAEESWQDIKLPIYSESGEVFYKRIGDFNDPSLAYENYQKDLSSRGLDYLASVTPRSMHTADEMDTGTQEPDQDTGKSPKIRNTGSVVDNDNYITVNRKRKNVNFDPNVNNGQMSHQKMAKANYNAITTSNLYNALKEINLHDTTVPVIAPVSNHVGKKIERPKVRHITIFKQDDQQKFFKSLAAVKDCKFTIAPAGKFTKIYPNEPVNYKAVTTELDRLNIPHYLIPEKLNGTPLKAVIRGLPIDTSIDEIQEELRTKFDVIKVTQMIRYQTQKPMPLFQVQIVDSETARTIFKIRSLLYYNIRIETYNRPTRTIQCHRCQFYHHTSTNCKMTPRCVKCTDSPAHETKDCPKGQGKIDQTQLKCCNCDGAHAASFRGCPKYPENRRPASNSIQATTTTKTYSNVASTSITTNTNRTNDINRANDINQLNSIFSDIAKELNANSITDLVQQYTNILNEIKLCSTQERKHLALIKGLNQLSSPSPAPVSP